MKKELQKTGRETFKTFLMGIGIYLIAAANTALGSVSYGGHTPVGILMGFGLGFGFIHLAVNYFN